MKIIRSQRVGNNVAEYRWHYDRSTVRSFSDKAAMYVSMFAVSHFLFWGMIPISALFILFVTKLVSFSIMLTIVCLYLTSLVFYRPHLNPNYEYWDYFRKHKMWDYAKFYLDWRVIRLGPTELYKGKQFITCVQPHGILVLNRIDMCGPVHAKEVLPRVYSRFAAASPNFYLAGNREASLWAGALSASRQVLDGILECASSVNLWVGGSRELLCTDPHSLETKMVILDRKGFIKLAIRNGVDILPCMQFGEKFIYRKFFPKGVFSKLLFRLRMPAALFWGRFATMLPFQHRNNGRPIRMGMVYARPIPVMKQRGADISDEYIDKIHSQYMEVMRHLFETYKAEFHYEEEQTLEMVDRHDNAIPDL